jgi:uncharacterized protein (TIGR02271 family)
MTTNNRQGTVDTTGEAVAAGTGGVAGAAAGAAIGSMVGPIGTIIGGLAGAVGGWWSGRAISEAATSYTNDDDAYYQNHYMNTSSGASARSFDQTRPAYQLGHLAGANPDYRSHSFDDVEPHLSQAYTGAGYNDWNDVRDYARDAYARGREVGEERLTLSEEQLRVGKRSVQAGEVTVHKTVETQHVAETVPLMREEITIERRPIRADAANSGDIEISADEIRIPLMAEEAVVEKRVVGTEEVLLSKRQVTENETVEADLRKERLEMNEDAQRASRSSGTGGTMAPDSTNTMDRRTP